MTLYARLRALVDAVPAGGAVTIPRDWLVEQLAAENGAPGSARDDDRHLALHDGPAALGTPGLLTAKQVADRLNCSTRYVYANAHKWPFTVRLGKAAVRFDAAGLERWLRRAA